MIVVMCAMLAALAVIGLTQLRFDFQFESFLPKNDPDLAYYVAFKNRFEKGNTSVAVGIYREKGVFEKEFLAKVSDFSKRVRKVPLVERATSLTTLKDYIADPNFPLYERVLDWKRSTDLAADSVRILNDPRMRNTFVAHTGQLLVVLLEVKGTPTFEEEAALYTGLTELIAEYDFENWHAIGHAITHYELTRQQQSQFLLFVLVATCVMLISMVLLFRRFWGTVIAFVSTFMGMIYFFGGLGLAGKPLDLMATLFPILLVIVGTSDVVHIMTKYVDELKRGRPRKMALRITIREIGLATFMTSLTTAIGFLSLLSSKMPPIRSFGLLAAIGVFAAFLTVMLLSLSWISWFSGEKLMRKSGTQSRFSSILNWTYEFTRQRPREIVIGTLLFLLVCGWGASRISLNLTNQRDLPRKSKILHDFLVLDEQLSGITAIDLAVETVAPYTLEDLEVQQVLARFEVHLDSIGITGPIHSPLVYYKIANRALHGNNPAFFAIAADTMELAAQQDFLATYLSDQTKSIISADKRAGQMFLHVMDVGSREVAAINARIDEWAAEHMDPQMLRITHTGHRYIFDKNQELLVSNLMQSLIIAFLVVAFFMALVFRNLRMVIISLIPNVVPLLITAAIIGFSGLEFDPKIAIVFTVAFGIAVDDSIHFLARFKLEYDRTQDVEVAIHSTFMETGKAIIITTLILFFGFSTMLFSVFPPTYTIGGLLSVTLAVALVADFLLLPICLRWMIRQSSTKTA